MGTFMAAYLAVWLASMLYIGWLGLRQRRMQRALDALQKGLLDDTGDAQRPAKAA